MVQMRVEATLARAGHHARSSGETAVETDIEAAEAVLLDLNTPAWESIVSDAKRAGRPVLAFGQHVDEQRLQRAREAGCTRVVVRSRFFNDMPSLVEAVLPSRPASP